MAAVSLEDSWVLSLDASLTELSFVLDLALTPAHSAYIAFARGQACCFARGTLRIESESAVLVRRSSLPPATDAAGELDYGHIDAFQQVSSGDAMWALTGDWGEALVREPRVVLELDDIARR
ncbi:hypothetical protein SAMN05444858_101262 [Micromonospora avicenniae]|uniref:Uncharacterized protein n=1 Tax=Micromonospora avicenniae TaxID=1198245 RepID=A0A1N6QBG3_9ACTN|nr:hypothetical protein SAMN05444858_101262 [Micromonospora avicenniae]